MSFEQFEASNELKLNNLQLVSIEFIESHGITLID